MSDIEFGVVQQPKGNGGKQSETETSTKKNQSTSKLPPTIKKGGGD